MKMYFKGDSGIKSPVDVSGELIFEGDILTRDFADNARYNIQDREGVSTEPFYEVKVNINGGYYAESIETIKDAVMPNSRFFLHDFRFKYTKKLTPAKDGMKDG